MTTGTGTGNTPSFGRRMSADMYTLTLTDRQPLVYQWWFGYDAARHKVLAQDNPYILGDNRAWYEAWRDGWRQCVEESLRHRPYWSDEPVRPQRNNP